MKNPLARSGFAVLALLALVVVIMRPLCQAAELPATALQAPSIAAEHGIGDGESCCPVAEETTLVVTRSAATQLEGIAASADAPGAGMFVARAAAIFLQPPVSAAPLPVPRYHARTARILR
jgi:hypothetical protein